MSLFGNIIWLVFGGFMSGIGYILGGLGTCLTIIGIPFGIEAIKLGFATFTPFGKEIVRNSSADTTLALILNIVWIVLFGWGIALSHLVWGVILAITIVGLPFARQHFKLVTLALWPFGHDLVRK
ncbi:YccF domain-containing protein [Kovacikia minuta CCNUW1]|uniref:YccF domain-containing protein n=1 Tax=Kovacikia minuta TaxID=2931930 RepID=UPI001CCB8842|nr:YccF domain-containing protein [Kovacikia minuta]UBF28154.1 YccF domain-containing protein [Kovacikia minuta CCNUW1]